MSDTGMPMNIANVFANVTGDMMCVRCFRNGWNQDISGYGGACVNHQSPSETMMPLTKAQAFAARKLGEKIVKTKGQPFRVCDEVYRCAKTAMICIACRLNTHAVQIWDGETWVQDRNLACIWCRVLYAVYRVAERTKACRRAHAP